MFSLLFLRFGFVGWICFFLLVDECFSYIVFDFSLCLFVCFRTAQSKSLLQLAPLEELVEQVALEEPEELALVVDVESSTRFCVKHQLILGHSLQVRLLHNC